jgi:hypothetical protein
MSTNSYEDKSQVMIMLLCLLEGCDYVFSMNARHDKSQISNLI